jgi:hypothetical protein
MRCEVLTEDEARRQKPDDLKPPAPQASPAPALLERAADTVPA